MNKEILDKVKNRRTFAIISHPDAGKTTLTEKLLLYGGAIHLAGSVKSRKSSRHATSDWMEIEKQRGISVTSSAMQFNYNGYAINILDTPGHQDFSEDTYRTLVAADSAVMLIDGAKGVEPQTIKLFHVCKMSNIPIFTFVNKMDRASKDPFELMEEIENVLGISSCPINWPIGTLGNFKGVYHRESKQVEMYSADSSHGSNKAQAKFADLDSEEARSYMGDDLYKQLNDEIELLEGAGDKFDIQKVLEGDLTPMFFGSAINNFGVESFLDKFLEYTLAPTPRKADTGIIPVDSDQFSAFVFKIQANMDPAHRDRLAFVRICSGKFEAGMDAFHVQGNRKVRLAQPQQFMADERSSVTEAWPGDIIGLFDPGIFGLGDTIITGTPVFKYSGIPLFAPERFARISPEDSLKRKQFVKGITQLSQEGAIQTFKQMDVGREELICGVVGVLQFDVLKYRLKGEYGVDINFEHLPFKFVRWIEGSKDPEKLSLTSTTKTAKDIHDRPVLLFANDWSIHWATDNNKGLVLSDTAIR
ncbi:MAG: peptide chain release factor 3 [Eubacteriales bacterium]